MAALLAAERAADLHAVGGDGRRGRLLALQELELEIPVLLLLEVPPLPLGLAPDLALLRPHVLTLPLDRARETAALLRAGRTGQKIEALIPRTGGIIFMDVMVIPVDAPHPENAHKFIEYILRPEVAAGLTNKVFYPNPNRESRKFINPGVANDPTVFLSEADMKKMALPNAINNDIRRQMTRIYTSFKTGL